MKRGTGLKSFVIIACIIGNIIQILQLSIIYFLYGVETNVSVRYPRNVHPPALSLCFFLSDVVNWKQIFLEHPEIKGNLGYPPDATDIYTGNMSTRSKRDHTNEIIDVFSGRKLSEGYSLASSQLFPSCSRPNYYNYREIEGVCDQVFSVTTYLRDYYKCWKFDMIDLNDQFLTDESNFNISANTQKSPVKFEYKKLKRYLGWNGFLASVMLSGNLTELTRRAIVLFSSRQSYPRSGTSIPMYIFNLTNSQFLSYTMRIITKLPVPYQSACIDYPYPEGRGGCWESCMRNSSIKAFSGRVVYGPLMTSTDDMLSFKTFNKSDQMKYQIMMESCASVCMRNNCTETLLSPILVTSVYYPGFSFFMVTAQPTPIIFVAYVPRVDFISYATQVTSTFGVWTGITLFASVFVINEYLPVLKSVVTEKGRKTNKKVFHRRKRRFTPPKRQYKFSRTNYSSDDRVKSSVPKQNFERTDHLRNLSNNTHGIQNTQIMFPIQNIYRPHVTSSNRRNPRIIRITEPRVRINHAPLQPKRRIEINYLTPLPPHIHKQLSK